MFNKLVQLVQIDIGEQLAGDVAERKTRIETSDNFLNKPDGVIIFDFLFD
jgi:hypothetical protein